MAYRSDRRGGVPITRLAPESRAQAIGSQLYVNLNEDGRLGLSGFTVSRFSRWPGRTGTRKRMTSHLFFMFSQSVRWRPVTMIETDEWLTTYTYCPSPLRL